MSSNEYISQLSQLLTNDLELANGELDAYDDWAALRERIAEVIQYLIENDLSRFFNMLYRLDIPETKVKQVIAGDVKESIYTDLADIILERELQKVKSRIAYSERQIDIDDDEAW